MPLPLPRFLWGISLAPGSIDGGFQVAPEIVGRFDADAESQEAIGDACGGTGLRGHGRMGRGRGMDQEASYVAEADGVGDGANALEHAPACADGRLTGALAQLERQE